MKHFGLQINHYIQKIETHLESNSFNLYYAQNVGQIWFTKVSKLLAA